MPTLIYQYNIYTNYPSKRFSELNSEIDLSTPTYRNSSKGNKYGAISSDTFDFDVEL